MARGRCAQRKSARARVRGHRVTLRGTAAVPYEDMMGRGPRPGWITEERRGAGSDQDTERLPSHRKSPSATTTNEDGRKRARAKSRRTELLHAIRISGLRGSRARRTLVDVDAPSHRLVPLPHRTTQPDVPISPVRRDARAPANHSPRSPLHVKLSTRSRRDASHPSPEHVHQG